MVGAGVCGGVGDAGVVVVGMFLLRPWAHPCRRSALSKAARWTDKALSVRPVWTPPPQPPPCCMVGWCVVVEL